MNVFTSMKKLFVTCMMLVASMGMMAEEATLSFADKAQRTSYSTEQQVWEQNGVKLTNNKSSSTSNVGDYANPGRFYKNSEIIVEYSSLIRKIVFICNSTSYADVLVKSITKGTVSAEGKEVTVTLSEPANIYTIAALSEGQVRLNSLTVYYGAESGNDGGNEGEGGGDLPEGTDEGTQANPYDAAKATSLAAALADGEKITGVYVKGIVKSIKEVSTQYGNATYYITGADNAANFYVYRGKYIDNASFTSEDQIKVGDAVVIYGDLMNYKGNSPQLGQGNYLVSINSGNEGGEEDKEEPQPVSGTIAEVVAAGAQASASTSGTVVATYARGFLISDGTGYILTYVGKDSGLAAGDVVTISGPTSLYGGLLQFGNTSTFEKTGTAEFALPEPEVLDAAAMDAFMAAPSIKYVQYTGVLSINFEKGYYNVNVAGTETAVGSIQYPVEGMVNADWNEKEITVTGFLIGVSNGKYLNTMAVSVVEGGTGIEAVGADIAPVYFDITGKQINAPARGLYIKKVGDKITKEFVR